MFRKLLPVPLVLALVLIVPCEVSFAQFSAVTGVVRDPNGGVIPGVTVTTIPQSGGVVRHTTSGRDGSYRFDGLSDGVYRVDFP